MRRPPGSVKLRGRPGFGPPEPAPTDSWSPKPWSAPGGSSSSAHAPLVLSWDIADFCSPFAFSMDTLRMLGYSQSLCGLKREVCCTLDKALVSAG